jgi:hypothetical protein
MVVRGGREEEAGGSGEGLQSPVAGEVSGFHQVALRSGLNGLRPQGLKEYSDSYFTRWQPGP